MSAPIPPSHDRRAFLAGLADLAWDRPVTIRDDLKRLPSGTMQNLPAGSVRTVAEMAAPMIAISDNTAADHLAALVGRPAVTWAQHRLGIRQPLANVPLLRTRELFALKLADWPDLADRYRRADRFVGRPLLLRGEVARAPLADPRPWNTPRDVDAIEWFASPADLARVWVGLAERARHPELAPLGSILSANDGGLGLDRAQWPAVWFKGGSEPGVLTLSYRLAHADGRVWAVSTCLADPANALPDAAPATAVAAVRGMAALLAAG